MLLDSLNKDIDFQEMQKSIILELGRKNILLEKLGNFSNEEFYKSLIRLYINFDPITPYKKINNEEYEMIVNINIFISNLLMFPKLDVNDKRTIAVKPSTEIFNYWFYHCPYLNIKLK